MNWRYATLAIALSVIAGVLLAPGRLRPARLAQSSDGAPAFSADKGKFRIVQGGTEVGTEEFSLSADGNDWVAHGDAVLRVPGSPETRSSGQLRLSADGTPVRYDWSAGPEPKASGSVTFENGTAQTVINVAGKEPFHQDFKFTSGRVTILDNNLYDQYSILGRLYDWKTKGKQSLPVLIPQDSTPGTIDLESTESGEARHLQVHTSDLDIELFFDSKNRLTRLEVPAANVTITRQ